MLALDRLRSLRESLRSSLWFVPSIIVLGAIALALTLTELDVHLDERNLREAWPRLFGAGAGGARGMLSTIAGSMITVAGVAFSITIVALALASSQYTSRILRSFMRDRANQTVLGAFLGIFVYCLVVLRTIREGEEGAFVPAAAVLFAVLLALVGIGCLIYFIHHIASSIQAENIIGTAAAESLEAVDRLFPDELGDAAVVRVGPTLASAPDDDAWRPILARRTGYIQGVNGDGLVRFARDRDAVVRMERGIGEFVVDGSVLVSVAGGEREDEEETIRAIDALFSVGRRRTMVQDVGFGVRQIVDVALKALSPGINDTTTAITCVDYLSAVLARLAERRVETPYRMDQGALRVIARGPSFASLLGEAFDQIRQCASGNGAVLLRVLQALEVIAVRTRDDERRRALKRQAELVAEVARRDSPAARDVEDIEAALARLGVVRAIRDLSPSGSAPFDSSR